MLRLNFKPVFFFVAATLIVLPFEGLRISGFPLVRTTGALCFLVFALSVVINPQHAYTFRRSHLLFALYCICLCLLSVSLGGEVSDSGLTISIAIASNLVFFLVASGVINNEKSLCIATYCLGYSLVLSVLLSVASDFSYVSLSADLQDDLGMEKTRQAGFLRNANRFAYLSLSVFWAGCLLTYLRLGNKFHNHFLIVVSSVCIIMSMARAGLGALFIGYFYLVFFSSDRRLTASLVGVLGFFFIFTDFSSLTNEIYVRSISMFEDRMDVGNTMSSGSISSRFAKYQSTFSILANNPVFGAPLGSLLNSRDSLGYRMHDPHNSFLYLLQYFGIFGMTIVCIGLATWIKLLASATHTPGWRLLITFWLLSLVFLTCSIQL